MCFVTLIFKTAVKKFSCFHPIIVLLFPSKPNRTIYFQHEQEVLYSIELPHTGHRYPWDYALRHPNIFKDVEKGLISILVSFCQLPVIFFEVFWCRSPAVILIQLLLDSYHH